MTGRWGVLWFILLQSSWVSGFAFYTRLPLLRVHYGLLVFASELFCIIAASFITAGTSMVGSCTLCDPIRIQSKLQTIIQSSSNSSVVWSFVSIDACVLCILGGVFDCAFLISTRCFGGLRQLSPCMSVLVVDVGLQFSSVRISAIGFSHYCVSCIIICCSLAR